MFRPTAPPQPARSTTKGTNTEEDHALTRRSVDAIVELTGVRRKVAREQVRAFLAGGQSLNDLEAYLRATFRVDPVGVTAVRNVARGGL